jgi:hypothetical protein
MGQVKKLQVFTRKEAHKLTMGEFKDAKDHMKRLEAVAFGICMVGKDGTISTMWCNHGGVFHTLCGSAHTLAHRITKDGLE